MIKNTANGKIVKTGPKIFISKKYKSHESIEVLRFIHAPFKCRLPIMGTAKGDKLAHF